ncbi:MAG: glycerate kinase [Candidatus Sumerlaeaceae bacterium]|nr:glycerate kinase [Candidatus Sumerlaeaceae bacterium]
MLTIVAAPNAFKGSASAAEVCRCIERAARGLSAPVRVVSLPMADGGDGTADVLRTALNGKWLRAIVRGPRGKSITSRYAWCPGTRTAIIEMALASGLALLKLSGRKPLHTTSHGTGELIAHALGQGARRILIAVGGSATVDGGAGALQALGAQFHDKRGRLIADPLTGGKLSSIHHADLSRLRETVSRAKLEVVCDVSNPLLGAFGAARVFGPQKGATPADVRTLEGNLATFSKVLCQAAGKNPRALSTVAGTGASGGLAFGLLVGCGAAIRPGARLVADLIALEKQIASCNLVISGEGAVDSQSFMGKVPDEVARLARKHRKPLVLIGGSINLGIRELRRRGVTAAFPLVRGPISLDEALRQTPALLTETAANVMAALVDSIPRLRLS